MRKSLVLAVVLLSLFASACDPAEETGQRPRDRDREPETVDLGELELVALVTEDRCADLLSWFKREASAHVDEFGSAFGGRTMLLEGGVRATAAPDAGGAREATAGGDESQAAAPPTTAAAADGEYSTTNVQEAGVDEPDIVKTDGRLLVSLSQGRLQIVDVTGERPQLLATTAVLPGAHALLLAGDRLLVFASESTYYPMAGAVARTPSGTGVVAEDMAIAPVPGYAKPKTRVAVVDLSTPASPRTVDTIDLDGSYVAARMIDGVARLVLRTDPAAVMQQFVYPGQPGIADEATAIQRNRAAIEATTISDWVPSHVECDQVHHPRGFTGASMVSVVSIDPKEANAGNGASVAGAGEVVYASGRRLYVSSMQWGREPARSGGPSTELHAFDITDPVTTRYVASGTVDGALLNQFSLSEHDGVLRVAATTVSANTGATESQVVTLREDQGLLRQLGIVGGLGKTERIYAVRFLGELGYVVTFRQVDPLYVLDLSDPARPTLMGELKIPGYSAYLHPIANGRLLGIGQNATDEGRRLGTQMSLFDVSDPAAPKQLATRELGSYSSSAEYDHHAFLWWARTQLAVVPVDGGGRCLDAACNSVGAAGAGAVGIGVDGDALVERGRIAHPTGMPISRSIVVGDALLTLSDAGLLASDLGSLAERGWLAF